MNKKVMVLVSSRLAIIKSRLHHLREAVAGRAGIKLLAFAGEGKSEHRYVLLPDFRIDKSGKDE